MLRKRSRWRQSNHANDLRLRRRRRKVKIQELDSPGMGNIMIGIEGISTCVNTVEARRVESRYDRGEAVEVKVFNIDGDLVCRVEITRDARVIRWRRRSMSETSSGTTGSVRGLSGNWQFYRHQLPLDADD